LDLFFLQLAIIFIPGIIWERMDALFAQKRRPDQFDVIRRAFIFGLVSYALTYGVYEGFGWEFQFVELSRDKTFLSPLLFREIIATSLVSTACSIAYLYVANRKILYALFQKVGATKRHGDEDIWDLTFNERGASVEYVHLRDFEKGIIYTGWVIAFSDTDKIRELVLRDAVVYNFDGQILFEAPRVYVARAMDKIDIEFPYREKGMAGEME